ncbi:MAG: hypothetical protein HC876_19605, partial [Chloroflexaceae bacterium]|nr:hypothetical protein [Chloroflexaceae bacterium]
MLLVGGASALLMLALALPATVRGFGSLFTWAVLAPAAALLGLSSSGFVLPFAWALAVLFSYSAVRASGSLGSVKALPRMLAFGLPASMLLLCYLLLPAPIPTAPLAGAFTLLLAVLACLMLAGAAPFHSALHEASEAPAALAALLCGLVLPLLALGTLVHLVADLRASLLVPELPRLWRGVLIGLGLIGLPACAAGALREVRMKRILAWMVGFQAASVVVALGVPHPLAALATSALLVNLALSTLVGTLAMAVLEWQTGSDDYTVIGGDPPALVDDLRLPAVLWGIAGLSALGLPGLWGFWGRVWLLERWATTRCVAAGARSWSASVLAALAIWCLWRGCGRPVSTAARQPPGQRCNRSGRCWCWRCCRCPCWASCHSLPGLAGCKPCLLRPPTCPPNHC